MLIILSQPKSNEFQFGPLILALHCIYCILQDSFEVRYSLAGETAQSNTTCADSPCEFPVTGLAGQLYTIYIYAVKQTFRSEPAVIEHNTGVLLRSLSSSLVLYISLCCRCCLSACVDYLSVLSFWRFFLWLVSFCCVWILHLSFCACFALFFYCTLDPACGWVINMSDCLSGNIFRTFFFSD